MLPAIIAAGASLLGGVLANRSSAKQAEAANQMSWDQMHAQNAFNATQSEVDFTRSRQSMYEANALTAQNMEAANNYQRFQNLEQMQFQDAQANKQMAFQERLANSAHQREIADLRLAGLNPILSGTGGMGSITPGGAMGTGHAGGPSGSAVSAPQARGYGSGSASFQQGRVVDAISPAVSSAIAASRAVEEIKLVQDQQSRTKAETLQTIARAERERTQADLDPVFAREERLQGVRKTEGEASTAQAEGERREWLKHVDRHFIEKEREAALALLKHQSANMEATAKSAQTKADLDEQLSGYERLINMGEGATSALSNLLPKIRLWESPRTRGREFSIGR